MPKMKKELQGKEILLTVVVAYPGSRMTDLRIGNTIVHIPNDDMVLAAIDNGLMFEDAEQ